MSSTIPDSIRTWVDEISSLTTPDRVVYCDGTDGEKHRLIAEVSSSNFPRFDRNLNTGGNNYDESKGVVAHTQIHHSKQYPSQVVFTVVKREQSTVVSR